MPRAVIVKTNVRQLKAELVSRIEQAEALILSTLSYIGEQAVTIARENGSYNDVTGNLRSSIGYVVLKNGTPVDQSESALYKQGSQGAPAAERLLKNLTAEYPSGYALIVCAGMEYAAYVEEIHHKDVLTSAEMVAQELANKLLKDIVNNA